MRPSVRALFRYLVLECLGYRRASPVSPGDRALRDYATAKMDRLSREVGRIDMELSLLKTHPPEHPDQ